jgi:hypothetical protein
MGRQMTSGSLLRCVRGPVVLALTAALPPTALACGFCASLNGNPLALPHPRAIEVAVATRAAIEKGQLEETCLVPQEVIYLESGGGMIALPQVPGPLLVKAWVRKCRCPDVRETTVDVHFLFIDTEEACGLSVRGGAVVFEARPSVQSDARVVTTRTTFAAMLLGKLGSAEARRRGLVLVEGDARAARLMPGGE